MLVPVITAYCCSNDIVRRANGINITFNRTIKYIFYDPIVLHVLYKNINVKEREAAENEGMNDIVADKRGCKAGEDGWDVVAAIFVYDRLASTYLVSQIPAHDIIYVPRACLHIRIYARAQTDARQHASPVKCSCLCLCVCVTEREFNGETVDVHT